MNLQKKNEKNEKMTHLTASKTNLEQKLLARKVSYSKSFDSVTVRQRTI